MEIEEARVGVARLVKEARHAANQTQAKLAERAGVSRGTVAAIETGARSPSWEMLTELLAAAGQQMRIELEPLDDDVRRAVSAQVGDTQVADDLSMTVSLMEGLTGLDYRFEGLAAATLLGAPLPLTEPIGLALPDGPEAVEWLAALVHTGAAAVTPAGHPYPLDGVRTAEGVARLVELGEGGRFLLESGSAPSSCGSSLRRKRDARSPSSASTRRSGSSRCTRSRARTVTRRASCACCGSRPRTRATSC